MPYSSASDDPQHVSAASGIICPKSFSIYSCWIVGEGGAIAITATPNITPGSADGDLLFIRGTDDTNTVQVFDHGTLAGSGLCLGGNYTLGLGDCLTLHWDNTQKYWVEVSHGTGAY
jgi:hypothetical protein